MIHRTSIAAWLVVVMTLIVASDAFAFHRDRRSSSQPIFSSNRSYLIVTSNPQPAATFCAPAVAVATHGGDTFSPARSLASSVAKL